jgi:hypothetical protein
MKTKTVDQLQKEFAAILATKKDAFLDMFREDVLGIEGVVGDADLAGNMLPTGKKYKVYGAGCSISYMKGKGVKGKKYEQAAGGAIMDFKRAIEPELIAAYPDKPVRPLMFQDITINEFLQHQARLWFRENGVTVECITQLN